MGDPFLAYTRLAEVKQRIDQAGTTHDYEYDKLGRLTNDKASALGTGIDAAVRRLSRAYEYRGLLETVTSHDATTGENVVNEAKFEYNEFSQLTKDWQEHGGVVSGATPLCQYAYASGTANTIRPTGITYPNGRVFSYDYGTLSAINDQLSRIKAITENSSDVVAYQYLGLDEFVEVNYTEPGVRLTYLKQGSEGNGDAGDKYAGLDRFYRVVDQRWLRGSTDIERVQYGFDANSSRIWRDNLVAGTGGKQDEYYTYDGLNQLKELDRGDLNSGKSGIAGTPTWEEQFTLGPTGNWPAYKTLTNGSTSLDQTRTHNKANELTQIDGSSSHVAEDPAGNMIKVPKANDWGAHYDLTYDAWNRLVKVKEGSITVAEYAYDGLTCRVKTVAAGTTRHYYYSSQWQALEERLNNATAADRQFLWGTRFLDDLVLRDRDANADGYLDERLFSASDYSNVTAIIQALAGVTDVKERYGFQGFGGTRVMAPDFSPRTASLYEWETRFGAYAFCSETGFYLVRYRVLHPLLGRWVTRDLVEYEAGINWYVYVLNSPTTFNDIFGLKNLRQQRLPTSTSQGGQGSGSGAGGGAGVGGSQRPGRGGGGGRKPGKGGRRPGSGPTLPPPEGETPEERIMRETLEAIMDEMYEDPKPVIPSICPKPPPPPPPEPVPPYSGGPVNTPPAIDPEGPVDPEIPPEKSPFEMPPESMMPPKPIPGLPPPPPPSYQQSPPYSGGSGNIVIHPVHPEKKKKK